MSTAERSTPDPSLRVAERLRGIACIVTGAAQGIGFETARELARLGGSVGIVDLDADSARLAARSIAQEFDARTHWAVGDVTDEQMIGRGFAEIAAEIGEVGVLVNCAGIMTPRLVPLTEMKTAEFETMLAVHVTGTFLCSRAVLPSMQRAGYGRIINIASVLGVLGLPFRVGYGTAKTAIIGFTRAVAVETARQGITVNAVAPGYILTKILQKRVEAGMIDYARLAERAPAGRWGLPEEVARVIGFLALPGSGFITGSVIPIDGGYTIRGDPDEDIGSRPESLDAIRELLRVRT